MDVVRAHGPPAAALVEENRLLGDIVEDLRRGAASVAVGAGSPQLRATEEALLDMHHECQSVRHALRKQADALQRALQQLAAERRAHAAERAGWRQLRVGEHVLRGELAALERREGDGALHLQSEVTRLREAAGEAVTGMREAQEECRWLHEQLRACLDDPSAAVGALRRQLTSLSVPPPPAAAAAPATAPLPRATDVAAHRRAGEGALYAMRCSAGYVQAVNRVHELQRHFARLCEHQGTLRPQLADALERLAAQRLDNHALRARVARAEAGVVAGEPTAAAVVTAAAAGAQGDEPRRAAALAAELAAERARTAAVERELAAAQREAAAATRALQIEADWVRALDEMRLRDMEAMQRLELELGK